MIYNLKRYLSLMWRGIYNLITYRDVSMFIEINDNYQCVEDEDNN